MSENIYVEHLLAFTIPGFISSWQHLLQISMSVNCIPHVKMEVNAQTASIPTHALVHPAMREWTVRLVSHPMWL